MVFVTPLATLVSLSTLSSFVSAATVQKPLLQLPADAAQNLEAVKDIFLYSYDAYKLVLSGAKAVAEILTIVTGSMRGVMMT